MWCETVTRRCRQTGNIGREMKIKYLKLKNWLLVSAMSLFGLSACNCHKEAAKADEGDKKIERKRLEDRIVPMYGVQTRDYRVETLDDGSKAQTDPCLLYTSDAADE